MGEVIKRTTIYTLLTLPQGEVPGEDDCGHCCFFKNRECCQPAEKELDCEVGTY